MKTLKILAKIFSIFIIGLFLATLIVPPLFKDDILSYIKNDINKDINAVLDVHDIEISLIKSFPDLRIRLDSLSLVGKDMFEDRLLYKAEKTYIDVSLISLLKKEKIPTINYIQLDKPVINIIILNDSLSNYLIFPTDDSDTTSFSYELALKKYKLVDGQINYHDHTLGVEVKLEGFNHDGKGDFTQDIFDLKTSSEARKMNFSYEGMTYLTDVEAQLDADINIDFLQDKYTLKDNILKLNELDITGDGFVQFEGKNTIIEAFLKSKSQEFRSIISLFPDMYTQDFKNVTTRGKASIEALIKGVYNSETESMPGFDIKMIIQNGYLKYPSLPEDVKDVFADIRIKASRPDYKDMSIHIPEFKLLLGKESIQGNLLAENLTGNQKMEGALKANVNLSNIKSVLPLTDVEKLSGFVTSDLSFSAKMSDIENENYQAIIFDGKAQVKNLEYQSKDQPRVSLSDATAQATPSKLIISADNVQLGKSDLSFNSVIMNPLAFVSTQKNMAVDISGSSKLFDLNEWQSSSTNATDDFSQPFEMEDNMMDVLDESTVKINWKSDKILWDSYEINTLALKGSLAKNKIIIDNFTSLIEGSDMSITGIVNNAFDYLFNGEVLTGNIDFKSKKLDLNKFMSSVPDAQTEEDSPMKIIPVPENLNLKINSHIDQLTYTNLILADFKGILNIKDQELTIENMSTQTLGGNIQMQGLYNTVDAGKPDFSVKLDLSNIKFLDAFNTFDLFKVAAPIAQYIQGLFNTTLVMNGQLGDQMMPILSSLDASGFLETLHGTLKNFGPIQKASSMLGVKELNNIDLSYTRNWFEIKEGMVELKPFSKTIKGMDMTMAGFHGLNKNMEYTMNLVIPRELVKGTTTGKIAESGLSFIENEARKMGVNIDQGTHFLVDVLIGGTLRNPTVKIVPKSSQGSTINEAVASQIDDIQETLKDTITKEIQKRTTQIKDTLSKRAEKEIDKAKTKAEKEIDKAVDSIKSTVKREVLTKADSLARGLITDSIRQKAKEILDGKAEEEVEKIKNKLKDFNPLKKKGN